MGRHVCLKEWINGNEVSVSIDDNLCDGFRGEVIVFHSDGMKDKTEIGSCRCPTRLAEIILEAEIVARKKEGSRTFFNTRILGDNDTLEV